MDSATPCLVLLCKRPAPGHAKQRLAATLGQDAALSVAQALLACALEDLRQWPGQQVIAPDHRQHLSWAQSLNGEALCRAQRDGNLGERLNGLDQQLRGEGLHQLMFIGSDCPALRPADYLHVTQLLQRFDTILINARDGGVVLMASNRPWPDLRSLPWSTHRLGSALAQRCRQAGHSVAIAGESFDIDHAEDLSHLAAVLRDDRRPARQALHAALERLGIGSDA
ncbi:hypothetical protein CH92_09815 [Stutzerimonas stutzeri]|uniref:DUF2064 domain-containing protein n=1 Tax=Stutzerimonas stutzeri TaxID=316 RepID=W8RAE8_STUST|nr:DUF2064 domain-containing protein [Stutzerimonas stutzeri]AHL75392.1 hypothetical protein CH92_09815 [Stutzerimonas stutzeri]MCQ4328050.1 DUF2064 domain-containing protein [Stutzerimonas stutzeri]